MKARDFIANTNIKFCGVVWWIEFSRYVKPITIKEEFFSDRKSREEFLANNSYWWEKLPFIHRLYYVGNKGCD
jgi:hypothetical protein